MDILKIVLKFLKLQQLEKLPQEYLMPAIENLDIETISKFCDGSLIFNDKVCNNNKYWIEKFKKDFDKSPETYQETYIKFQFLIVVCFSSLHCFLENEIYIYKYI